ncbi:hypothetical protein GUJ93_ZPchr0010g7527 [Zizania palustris]|uniref:Uncharacterized protein n=1 Tax=Zizania palustris TaxID=103762 RepID=A0A8J6BRI6_ZIZPA|nr:hypothetical protein GUJ93_ZPchr0010g7527 [Zizania palustris]
MEVDAPSSIEAIDDGTVERPEAEAEAVGSEPRVMASEGEEVILDPASTSSGFEGSQAYEIDFRKLFAPSKYIELSPNEEVKGTLPNLFSSSKLK